MKELGTVVLWAALAFVAVTGLGYWAYVSTAFYAPRYEDIRRTTFEHSRAFNEGMVRDLENLKMQYQAATDVQKIGLRATIIHRFEVYPIDSMTPDLQTFYASITQGSAQ